MTRILPVCPPNPCDPWHRRREMVALAFECAEIPVTRSCRTDIHPVWLCSLITNAKGVAMGMFDQSNPYQATYGDVAALAQESERTAFIRRTYAHLTGAVALFIALETLIFTVTPPETL